MHLKTKTALLAAAAFFAAGLIIWPGCATPPLPASRTPISHLKRTDFSFGKNEHPTREQIAAKLGQPDEYFADLRVACYKLNRIQRRRLWLLFGILPIAAPKDREGLEFAMIQFDDHDREQRVKIRIVSGNYFISQSTLDFEAQRWTTKPPNVLQGQHDR